MSEEQNKNRQNQERSGNERRPDVNIEKGRKDEGVSREKHTPLSWQPIKDETDPNPPDGGSGVDD